jgi:hypothetical protein
MRDYANDALRLVEAELRDDVEDTCNDVLSAYEEGGRDVRLLLAHLASWVAGTIEYASQQIDRPVPELMAEFREGMMWSATEYDLENPGATAS